jgi:ankyrin repeat protein
LIEYGLEDAMLAILRARPKVDALDLKKMTALHVACGKGDLDLIKLLVRNSICMSFDFCIGSHNVILHRLKEAMPM